jgi:hypothetical protein
MPFSSMVLQTVSPQQAAEEDYTYAGLPMPLITSSRS